MGHDSLRAREPCLCVMEGGRPSRVSRGRTGGASGSWRTEFCFVAKEVPNDRSRRATMWVEAQIPIRG